MQAGAVPHDLRREEPALDVLHDQFDEQDQPDELPAAAGLEKRERQRDRQADGGAEVGHDVEQAECEPERHAELQADDGKPNRQQHAHDQPDDQLPAEKGDHDAHEFAG